jgi:hypothetical protein
MAAGGDANVERAFIDRVPARRPRRRREASRRTLRSAVRRVWAPQAWWRSRTGGPACPAVQRSPHAEIAISNPNELVPWGEVVDPRERARLLDTGLSRLAELWAGEFEPRPLQQPRIPVWAAARWPNRRPSLEPSRWTASSQSSSPGRTRSPSSQAKSLNAEVKARGRLTWWWTSPLPKIVNRGGTPVRPGCSPTLVPSP